MKSQQWESMRRKLLTSSSFVVSPKRQAYPDDGEHARVELLRSSEPGGSDLRWTSAAQICADNDCSLVEYLCSQP